MSKFNIDNLLIEDNSNNSFYRTSFFEIYLSCPFNKEFDDLAQDKQRLGLFTHEYIHYLQNISTPWGVYASMVRYEGVIETLNQLRSANDIKIPFVTKFSQKHLEHKKRFEEGEGDSDFTNLYSRSVDLSKKIDIKSIPTNNNGQQNRRCIVVFTDNFGVEHKVHIGAKIIRESMAFMYQTLIDDTAKTIHDVPYNIIRIISLVVFQNIEKDTVKLITLCHLSLYSMNPSQTLYDLLCYANKNAHITSLQLVDSYMERHTAKDGNQNSYTITELCDRLADDLIRILNNVIPSGLEYLKFSIDAARLSKGYIPPLNVLYGTESLTIQHIKSLISYLGIPYLTDSNHNLFFNSLDGKAVSNDLLFIRIISIVLEMLTVKRPHPYCPSYKHECDGSLKQDYECLSHPWKGEKCAFTEALDFIGINRDVIHW